MKLFVALLFMSIFAILVDSGPSMHNPYYCYANDPIRPMLHRAGHATSYEIARRSNFTPLNPYESTCTASRFWFLGVYSAWLPNVQAVQSMIDLGNSSVRDDVVRSYEAGRTTLCRQDYENIRNFTIESEFGEFLTVENAGRSMEAGIIAQQNLAKRFRERFSNVFTENYTSTHYHFRHNSQARTNISIRAFASGLFGEAAAENVIYEPVPEEEDDWLLMPISACPLFSEESAYFQTEELGFRDGPELQEVINQVNRKLGLQGSTQLDFNQIEAMWYWCRFEVGTMFELSDSDIGGSSAWCAPFSVANFETIEYLYDLYTYHLNGYGLRNQRLLQNLNCGKMQDLLRHMQSENDTDTKVRIFSGSIDIVRIFLVALGAFRDVWPLHRHNFAQQFQRRWVSSALSAFSANLAVVRYDCDDGDHDLIFLLNENPILIPGCNPENGVCKLSFLVNRFERFIDADCETLFCSSG